MIDSSKKKIQEIMDQCMDVIDTIDREGWDEEDYLLYCVSRDISYIKQQQLEVAAANKRYKYVTKATSDVIWDWNIKDSTLYRAEGFDGVYDGEREREFNSIESWGVRIHPKDKDEIINNISALIDDVSVKQWKVSYRYLKSDGEYAFVLDRGYIIRDKKGEAVRMIGAMQDITDLKEREERTQRFHKVIAELATDRSLPKMELNEALAKVLEISAKTLNITRVNTWLLEGDNLRCIASYDSRNFNIIRGQVLKNEKYPAYFKELTENRTLVSNKVSNDERLTELTDSYFEPHDIYSLLGTSIKTSGKAQVVVCHESVSQKREWQDDEISFAGAIADQVAQLLDNEEKKKKEQELKRSLKEKETLLTEVHHRVKNNLAVISGMIELQALDEPNESMQNKFMDWVSRINSISSIHQHLYQSDNFSKLEFSENLKILAHKIIETIRSNTKIDLTLDLSPVDININQAIPCSMIVNEVITNIIKHAFGERGHGKIWINLKEDQNKIKLSIKDNGKGLPADFEVVSASKSMGMKLIDTLAIQLEADYNYQSSQTGTTFLLQFKKMKA